MFWQERPLGTLQTLHATDEGPTFCRVRAAGTHTVEEPFLSEERSPYNSWFVSLHVLVCDLLTSFYIYLGYHLDTVVRINH